MSQELDFTGVLSVCCSSHLLMCLQLGWVHGRRCRLILILDGGGYSTFMSLRKYYGVRQFEVERIYV